MPPEPNSANTGKGKALQVAAAAALSEQFHVDFQLEQSMPIGSPPKPHRFDLATPDGKYVAECKNYSWTEGGNVPAAKMHSINEAVLLLSFLPAGTQCMVVMRLDRNARTGESLADYYYRTYQHLLRGVSIVELDLASGKLRTVDR